MFDEPAQADISSVQTSETRCWACVWVDLDKSEIICVVSGQACKARRTIGEAAHNRSLAGVLKGGDGESSEDFRPRAYSVTW
ncbi:hypothetical protein Tco_1408355 [Tanacetum coccineum]